MENDRHRKLRMQRMRMGNQKYGREQSDLLRMFLWTPTCVGAATPMVYQSKHHHPQHASRMV